MVGMVGPLEGLSRADLVRAVATVARRHPSSRIAYQGAPSGGGWIVGAADPGRWASDVVVSWDRGLADGLGAVYTDLARRTDLPFPLAVVMCGDHVALRVTHALGDGRLVENLLAAIVQVAAGGDAEYLDRSPARAPLAKGLVRFAVRNPRAAVRGAGAVVSRGLAVRSAQARRPPGTRVHWAPDKVVTYARMSPGDFAALRRWRREAAPGCSTAVVQLVLIVRALLDAGVQLDDRVMVPFDARRYLRPGAYVPGNFSIGVPIEIPHGTTLSSVGDQLVEAAATGRPLTALASAYLRRREAGTTATERDPEARPRLAFTHLGRPRVLEGLPWQPDAQRVYSGSVEPAGPEGITAAVTEVGGAMHVSFTYHRNVVDEALVVQAAELVESAAVALLADGSTKHPARVGNVHPLTSQLLRRAAP